MAGFWVAKLVTALRGAKLAILAVNELILINPEILNQLSEGVDTDACLYALTIGKQAKYIAGSARAREVSTHFRPANPLSDGNVLTLHRNVMSQTYSR